MGLADGIAWEKEHGWDSKPVFKNHHAPAEWQYESQGKKYIKVGAYGIDDLEYKTMGTKTIINGHKIYATLEEAYTEENRLWSKYEEAERQANHVQ